MVVGGVTSVAVPIVDGCYCDYTMMRALDVFLRYFMLVVAVLDVVTIFSHENRRVRAPWSYLRRSFGHRYIP